MWDIVDELYFILIKKNVPVKTNFDVIYHDFFHFSANKLYYFNSYN